MVEIVCDFHHCPEQRETGMPFVILKSSLDKHVAS